MTGGIRLQIIDGRGEKRLGKILELLFTDAGDTAELDRCRGIGARHFAQRHVGENHVGRHIARVGQRAADAAEVREECFVAFDFAGALFQLSSAVFRPAW